MTSDDQKESKSNTLKVATRGREKGLQEAAAKARGSGGNLQALRDGALGTRLRRISRTQARSDLLHYIWVRQHRPLPQSGRVQPGGSVYERLDEYHRISRQSTGQGGCAHYLHLSKAAGGQRHIVRLYLCLQERTGTDGRYCPAGGWDCLHHLGVVQLFC